VVWSFVAALGMTEEVWTATQPSDSRVMSR
jgi:hypothetical protein